MFSLFNVNWASEVGIYHKPIRISITVNNTSAHTYNGTRDSQY
jgi:hypothetical protein